MSLDERFNKAADNVKKLKTTPKDDDLLEIYALFKQGSVGDVNVAKPTGLLDFKGKAKWEAWNAKKGMAIEAAKEAYIAKVQELIDSVGLE